MSRPLWARELKQQAQGKAEGGTMSRPLWARELKHKTKIKTILKKGRAPCGRVN